MEFCFNNISTKRLEFHIVLYSSVFQRLNLAFLEEGGSDWMMIWSTLSVLLWMFHVATCAGAVVGDENLHSVDNYAIVIDAGSTGSRCFVFHVVIDAEGDREVTGHPCGKVVPGLSSYLSQPEEAGPYLAPLLINAAEIIPASKHSSSHVYLKATAGMRLLSVTDQQKIFDEAAKWLREANDIPFPIADRNIGTINGHEEAYFAVIASNYIHGSIDGNLHPVDGMPLMGALDMGGGSTQLIFFNGTKDNKKVNADDFWSHSWLNYGAQRIQERVLNYIVSSYLKKHDLSYLLEDEFSQTCILSEADDDKGSHCLEPIVIDNPCGFRGHHLIYSSKVHLKGTGEGQTCMDIIEEVIWPSLGDEEMKRACMRGRPCPIESIEHPSVQGHHFYAMSVFFYALDCMRQVGLEDIPDWPKPSLRDLESATMRFCGWQWDTLYISFVGGNKHSYTRDGQLQDRCFESLYILTLLEKGFGFDRDERSITFALEVGGSEVEWTLGFALAEIDFRPHLE